MDDLKEILKSARIKKGISQTEMADLLGVELGQTYSLRQYQRLEDGAFPKYKREVVDGLDKILGTTLSKSLYDKNGHKSNKSVSNKHIKKKPQKKENPATPPALKQPDPKDLALLKLANSNEALARSHEKLVNMLEKKFIESDDQRRLREAEATIRGTREFLCELDSHVNKRPVQESWELVGIKVDAAMEELGKIGNPAGAHK